MRQLTPHDVMTMFLALAVLLGSAKLAGELVHKIGQPAVLGEVGRLFHRPETVEQALSSKSFVEFMAAINAPVAE